ncbi:MAG: bifunctional 4'-phosphopantothenoylcysteine decarboxylase/phosphopantothenoylcysteine synthetase, partial [Deltaproteobacteria bacterium]|nr:bifunctional 4'-phosphopantothenoylcysteine decarboxylase/phosphopantothenoylcysteine synthetase [Deltaproteobacteria bacterium]
TLLLATQAEIVVAPAMNVHMWQHAATQTNVETLRARGVQFVGPDSGFLACGWEGAGRMSDPEEIAAVAELRLGPRSLAGQRVLVTAGGTREAIDPVRAITNRSSGKMGFAIAARVDVESALDMRSAVLDRLDSTDLVVKAAAVADFRPASVADQKIKKESLPEGVAPTLELVRNPDILAEVSQAPGDRIVVGFAAESEDLVPAARRKLARKGCDLIVANDVSREGAGFDGDTNAVVLVWPGGEVEELPLLTKAEVAGELLDRIEKLWSERS